MLDVVIHAPASLSLAVEVSVMLLLNVLFVVSTASARPEFSVTVPPKIIVKDEMSAADSPSETDTEKALEKKS